MAGLGQKVVTKSLQRFWRFSRGLTLGAQGLVMDADSRILLVKLSYRPGWHFPGGGVERNETIRTALRRELEEEAGIIVDGEPQLFSVYANFKAFPSDHIAFFVVRQWQRPNVPPPNREVLESRFFSREALPPDIVGGARRRLAEVLDGAPISEAW